MWQERRGLVPERVLLPGKSLLGLVSGSVPGTVGLLYLFDKEQVPEPGLSGWNYLDLFRRAWKLTAPAGSQRWAAATVRLAASYGRTLPKPIAI
jgi:hypothetical protein